MSMFKEEIFHEKDCLRVCVGCERKFCDIKIEDDLFHDEELPGSHLTTCGDYYCNIDCFRDSHG